MRLPLLALTSAILVFASGADAAELVMYRRAGCQWCIKWESEIAPIYPKTDIGRQIPLRVVDFDRDNNVGFDLRSPIRYTPTFVLVEMGREVGRIEGYNSEDFFWGLLEGLLTRLPSKGLDSRAEPRSDIKRSENLEQIV